MGLWSEGGELWQAIVRGCERCNIKPVSRGLEFVECLEEAGQLVTSERPAILENLPIFMVKLHDMLAYMKRKHPKSPWVFAMLHTWDEKMLDDLNGHMTPAQFARDIHRTKASVNNIIMEAQMEFKTPPRRDQRKPEERKKMRESRLKQLE
jgi:hypothetical protein